MKKVFRVLLTAFSLLLFISCFVACGDTLSKEDIAYKMICYVSEAYDENPQNVTLKSGMLEKNEDGNYFGNFVVSVDSVTMYFAGTYFVDSGEIEYSDMTAFIKVSPTGAGPNYYLTDSFDIKEVNDRLKAGDEKESGKPASGDCKHKYTSKVTKAATCKAAGIKTFTCTLCGDTYTDTVAKLNTHSYTSVITKTATCTQSGKKTETCSVCGISVVSDYTLETLSANTIFENSKNAVGEIETYNKSGSELALGTGFTYSADGRIITNYHVIEGAYSAKITINGTSYTVKSVLAYDKDIDLAVLKIDASNLTVVDVCTSTHAVGQAVYAFGSSQGLTATFSQGIITYADREIDGVNYVQHDAAISSGNSGGPLINQYGEIIGINTMTIRDSQNLNFAISVKELSNLTYGSPLTMAQLYEKENSTVDNVFSKVKNYLISNGEYDAEDNEYEVNFGIVNISDTSAYMTIGCYNVDDEEITLSIYLRGESSSHMVFIDIDEIDGVYSWSYVDTYEYYMSGTIYASTWTSNSLLAVSNYTVPSSIVTTTRELASSMVTLLLNDIKYDYSSIGVKASDFGFVNIN